MRLLDLAGALRVSLLALIGAACVSLSAVGAEPPAQKVTVDSAGTIIGDGIVVPPSDLLSPEARRALVVRLTAPPFRLTGGVAAVRATVNALNATMVEKWLVLHPSTITPVIMNGVKTDIITPNSGIAPENVHRVLINLHGGGFFNGGGGPGGQVESLPVSAQGRIKVVTIDYRMAPEFRFPAASQDVEMVYRKLLETYKPETIGIYGCSAGGTLTAQSVAWFLSKHLPLPGAIGIFCSGAVSQFWYGGDSTSVGSLLNGKVAATPEQMKASQGNLYLAGINQNDPLITPGLFRGTLARFPPTLVVTGTRDVAMSNALVTNLRLLEAGAQTQLLVLEGVGHGEFNFMAGTPEGDQAFREIWRFFDKYLAR